MNANKEIPTRDLAAGQTALIGSTWIKVAQVYCDGDMIVVVGDSFMGQSTEYFYGLATRITIR